ncbi:terpene synthase family protein [Chitinophaga japonensis]|uniref:Prenyltransferase/squalene oxidase-like repeat protein n=1 Tax=Chitinophaga japonensis TaxID=104662 RepID=A0A562SP41_CHIJA|nr:prenyltransferase/squalene oxidase repeat-containing protein [Chitinophaga japonensis]TWI82654.1 prenyltransferase/squalene oxidase-like repeat protein [Chitinophaga japonensis]
MQNTATLKDRLIGEIKDTLRNLENGAMPPAAYDTAWVARISSDEDPAQPMFPQCLQWLLQHQHNDGSWGNGSDRGFYHDQIISTLAAVVCLQGWQRRGMSLQGSIESGTRYLDSSMQFLDGHPYGTNGFEILFPALLQEALDLGVGLSRHHVIDRVLEAREEKLKKISFDAVFEKPTTLLFSLEGFPLEQIDWDKAFRLQDTCGSFLTSPAATAFAYIHTRNHRCLAYLQQTLERFNYIPTQYPLDIFQTAWSLKAISKLGLEHYFETEYNEQLDRLQNKWNDASGISWSSVIDLPDLDDTAVTYYLLKKAQRPTGAGVFENFYRNGEVFCFPGETQSSPTHLLHLLQVYNGNNTGLVNTARQQLSTTLSGRWTDKWHLSPYYVTSIATDPTLQDGSVNVDAAVNYVLATQHPDGGWGHAGSNAEETGLACMTLLLHLSRSPANRQVIAAQLQKGIDFLLHIKTAGVAMDTRPLWIAKCLYTPYSVVNTLVNAVLLRYLAGQEQQAMNRPLLAALTGWMEQHIALDNARIAPVAAITMDIAGRESSRVQEALFKFIMWAFGIDDLYDAGDYSLEALQDISGYLLENEPSGLPPLPGEKTAVISDLRALTRELFGAPFLDLPAHAPSRRRLADMIAQVIHAMLAEATWKRTGLYPDLLSYLENGRVSVSTPLMFSYIHCFMAGDAAVPEKLLNISGEIIRLVNDMATYKRELEERKLNSVTIIQQTTRCSVDKAIQQVKDMIAERMLQMKALAGDPAYAAFGEFSRFMIHVCEAEQRFYGKGRDFR